jgi:hypothetical protein
MIESDKPNDREKVSRLIYFPAIASLIPFLGIPFGLSAILWGISDWKIGGKKAVEIASAGILLSLLLGWYFVDRIDRVLNSPQMQETKISYSQTGLAFIIRYLEYYKLGHGHYPSALADLKENDISFKGIAFTDPFSTSWLIPVGRSGEQPYFYATYENGSSYDLFSVGPDKTPFTSDDIFPIILDDYKSVIGLRTRAASSP